MAEKRMISKTIVDSDAFLDMPQTTQNLYFHLNIRADDEGFLNSPRRIMKIIGSNKNDLEILLAKNYLIAFESGVIVIKHWKLHNSIRKDRLKKTLYVEEKAQLKEKKNGSYKAMTTRCQPDVNQMSAQYSIESSKEDYNTITSIEESFPLDEEDSITESDIKILKQKQQLKELEECYNKIQQNNPESEELIKLQNKIDLVENKILWSN